MRKNSKPTVTLLKFESRSAMLDYLHSRGVRRNELNKLNTK